MLVSVNKSVKSQYISTNLKERRAMKLITDRAIIRLMMINDNSDDTTTYGVRQ